MSKTINCSGCSKYLGIIHDAKLRTGIVFLCRSCEIKRIASDLSMKTKPKEPYESFMEMLKKKQ